MIAVALRRGVSLDGQRARKVRDDDFAAFDAILAMDAANARDLRRRCPPEHAHKIELMRRYDPEGEGDVPDPYYGGPRGFDDVFEMLGRSGERLLAELERG